jgi:outer membrane protein OmpA-like peptidoglycan-associated protein
MTNRLFITLLLSTQLMLPGLPQPSQAQQGNANAPASQSPALREREPLRPVTSADFWDGDDPNVVHLIMHPFASKKYVRRHTEPIRDRLNELEQITAENTKMIKDVDARAQHGIQLAAENDTLADQHAGDAALQAQVAQAAAADATTRASGALQMVGSLDQYKDAAQTEIHFRSGQGVLSAQAKDALDQLTAPLKDQHSYIIEVHGFAAGSGQAAIATSRMMAGSVVRYLLLNRKIPMYRIYAVGLGNAHEAGDRTSAKRMTGGRVEVNVLKNDVVSAAQH